MFKIESINNCQNLLVTNKNVIHIFHLKNSSEVKYEHSTSTQITECAFLPQKNLLAFSDLEKSFLIIDLATKSVITKKTLSKRASKITFTHDESSLVLADKTGDVYTLSIDSNVETNEFKLIMGHMSILTDLLFAGNEKYLITSDRDEKIRISCFPNSYNIHAFLLGHKEFVSQMENINDNILLSTSGDAHIILWSLTDKDFRIMQQIDVNKLVKNDESKDSPAGIDHFVFEAQTKTLIVHLFKADSLILFKYCDQEKKLTFISELNLGFKIHNFLRLAENVFLFLSFDQKEASPFILRRFENNQFKPLNEDEEISKFAKLLSVGDSDVNEIKKTTEEDYLSMFKAKVNNTSYYELKQERIDKTNATAAKRKRTKSPTSAKNENEDDSASD